MLDELLAIQNTQDRRDVFAILNTTMNQAQAVDLLLSVFGYERSTALAGALTAEIKHRKAVEKDTKTRVSAVRRKVAKSAN